MSQSNMLHFTSNLKFEENYCLCHSSHGSADLYIEIFEAIRKEDELTCPHYLPLFVMSKKCLKQVLFIPKRPITKMTCRKKRNGVGKYSIIYMKYNESTY